MPACLQRREVGERELAVAPQAANLGVDAADFNRDGKLDVVTSGGWMFAPNRLLVLLTDGPTVVLPGPQTFVGFLVGDFNNDGTPDVLYMAHAADRRFGLAAARGCRSGPEVLVNQRNTVNRPPIVSALDRVLDHQDYHPLEGSQCPWVRADASDPDQHAVTIEWRDSAGTVISTSNSAYLCDVRPGTYRLTVTVRDGRGAEVAQPVVLTIQPGREIVLYAVGDRGSWMTGNWSPVADPTAAGGLRAYDRNAGAAKVTVPSVVPRAPSRSRSLPIRRSPTSCGCA